MNDLTSKPYAKWLEGSLQNMVSKPVKSICILSRYEDDSVGTGYYDCAVSDKILFAGFLSQDAMLNTLVENGLVEDMEDDEEDDEEDEYDGEE